MCSTASTPSRTITTSFATPSPCSKQALVSSAKLASSSTSRMLLCVMAKASVCRVQCPPLSAQRLPSALLVETTETKIVGTICNYCNTLSLRAYEPVIRNINPPWNRSTSSVVLGCLDRGSTELRVDGVPRSSLLG